MTLICCKDTSALNNEGPAPWVHASVLQAYRYIDGSTPGQEREDNHEGQALSTVNKLSLSPAFLEAPQTGTQPNGDQNVKFSKTQKTCHLDTPSVLIPLWVLQHRHPNRYQNKRAPKCLVCRNQKTCYFQTPSVLISRWVLLTL